MVGNDCFTNWRRTVLFSISYKGFGRLFNHYPKKERMIARKGERDVGIDLDISCYFNIDSDGLAGWNRPFCHSTCNHDHS